MTTRVNIKIQGVLETKNLRLYIFVGSEIFYVMHAGAKEFLL